MSTKIIAVGPPKEAALYFESVLPMDLASGFLAMARKDETDPLFDHRLHLPLQEPEKVKEVVESLLPDIDNAYGHYVAQFGTTAWVPFSLLARNVIKKGRGKPTGRGSWY